MNDLLFVILNILIDVILLINSPTHNPKLNRFFLILKLIPRKNYLLNLSSPIIIQDYAETAEKNKKTIRAISGNQAGDPVRAVKAMIQVVESETPPMRLLLGAAALRGAREKLEELKNDFDTWASVSEGADFPKS